MPSIHAKNSRNVAIAKGAFAGATCAIDLWDLSKRELIEVALRLGALLEGECDNPEVGCKAVIEELQALRESGVV